MEIKINGDAHKRIVVPATLLFRWKMVPCLTTEVLSKIHRKESAVYLAAIDRMKKENEGKTPQQIVEDATTSGPMPNEQWIIMGEYIMTAWYKDAGYLNKMSREDRIQVMGKITKEIASIVEMAADKEVLDIFYDIDKIHAIDNIVRNKVSYGRHIEPDGNSDILKNAGL